MIELNRLVGLSAAERELYETARLATATAITAAQTPNQRFAFHRDPWWNPALEDQATDRAHRIGQSRPVTLI